MAEPGELGHDRGLSALRFPVDASTAAATVCFLWLFGEPMLEKLDRIKVKYGLLA